MSNWENLSPKADVKFTFSNSVRVLTILPLYHKYELYTKCLKTVDVIFDFLDFEGRRVQGW